ncbi:MAG: lipase family alpha/beta hydrolase, partial [Xenococcus sp. (in: cyanobacteria)]
FNTATGDKGWEIDSGALQGIPKPSSYNDKTTRLAIFPAGTNGDDLQQLSNAIGTAEATKVLTTTSKVKISETTEDLDENQNYWAVVTSLPLEPLKVYFQASLGEENGLTLVENALQVANAGQPSLSVKQVENATEADYHLLAKNGQYWIIQDERPVVAPIPEPPGYSEIAAKETIQALEAIARWTNILNLQSTASGIKSNDVEMEFITYGYEDNEGNISRCENKNSDNRNFDTSEYYLEYKYEDQQWKRPIVKVKLTNHSEKQLFCSVLLLSTDYTIAPRILYQHDGENWDEYEEDTITLYGKSSEKSNTFEGFVFLQIEEDFLDKGITEIKDVFKLIVSKTDFNADFLEQEGLKPPSTKRGKAITRSIPEGTLESLMLQVHTRSHGAPRRKVDDWITKELAVTIVKPRDAEELKANQSVELLNGLVEVQSHPSLEAKVTLTTVAQTTRDIGNLVIPSILKDEQGVIDSFQFTSSRGDDPGLSALELFNIKHINSVTKEQPLKILVNQTLEEDAELLPVSYDGEFFLPLGRGTQDGERIKITLERLPEPTTSSRSLGGSIKIFFKKLRHKKLGHSYDYPILTTAEVTEENNKIKVSYQPELSQPNLEEVKQRVDSAEKIVLYIHGIIGDTQSMVGSVQRAQVEIDGQLKPLRELYDLVLTFDYENLHTTIEENARLLKQRLESVGLGANHGKELHIVAHSMGGLVSRWFIEREEGNQVIQHLVMLGTPNAGSPWPAVQDMTFSLLSFGLNQIPDIAWPAKVVADLTAKSLEFVEENDNALDQMQPDSEFLQAIATNSDPQVLYTIISGDRSIPRTERQLNRLQRLMAKLSTPIINTVVDDLVFGGEPNDIAVLLASIKSVSGDRSPSPRVLPDVACDHLTYFTTKKGLEALADALHP